MEFSTPQRELDCLWDIYLEERIYSSGQAITDITRWDSLTWPSQNTCSDLGHKYEFSSKVIQSEKQAKFQPRNKTSHNYGLDLCG